MFLSYMHQIWHDLFCLITYKWKYEYGSKIKHIEYVQIIFAIKLFQIKNVKLFILVQYLCK